jgi:hypothetical protein
LDKGANLILFGPPGGGKSHLCSAIGLAFETQVSEWEECRLPFVAFAPTFRGRALTGVPALNAARVRSVGFLIAGKQNGPFRLEIDWVKAT